MRTRNRKKMRQAVIRKQLTCFFVQPAAAAKHHAAQQSPMFSTNCCFHALAQLFVPQGKALPPQNLRFCL